METETKFRGPAARMRLTAAFADHVHVYMATRRMRARELCFLAFGGDDSDASYIRMHTLLARRAVPATEKHLTRVRTLVFVTGWPQEQPATEPAGVALELVQA